MKTIGIALMGLGLGVSAVLAQIGAPVTVPVPAVPAVSVPAPAMTAPAPAATATVQPKPVKHPQRNAAQHTERQVVQPTSPAPRPRQNRQHVTTQSAPGAAPTTGAVSYADALKRQHRERHDRGWWTTRYRIIVLVNGAGYYYCDGGYWYPAYGYDPDYETFEYDGPIYTYGKLLPDQVVYNVQRALKDLGYYDGPLTGSYSAATRLAIRAFQADNELETTGAIDAATVGALGLS